MSFEISCESLFSHEPQLQVLAEKLREYDPEYPVSGTPSERRAADRALVEKGALNEIELLKLYAGCFDVELMDEDDIPLPGYFPGLSEDYLNSNLCLPLEWDENTLVLLVSSPYHLARHAGLIKRSLKRTPSFVLVRRTFLERLLSKVLEQSGEDDDFSDNEDENMLRSIAGEARIVRLVNDIFTRAIELGASDIHVEPGEDHVAVRCRVDGVLTEIMSCPLNQFPAISSRIKLIGGLNIAESRLPQDGRTNFRLGKTELDMRISTIPILTGESIVLRLLNKEAVEFDLKNLGMSEECRKRFDKLISIPHGIILVVGPTGSGKTTTLYSVLTKLNDSRRKIITIEDPVEYQTPGICQMQINHKIGVDFASGLRHIVRQDPDVILVGEIRDLETADIAINAALTGHLVLSTLHTNDAVGAVTRLQDMGVESFLISSSLYGILSQRLVRKVCTKCGGTGIDVNMTGNKCKRCNGSGYKGRSGIFELLLMSDALRRAVNAKLPSSELEKIAVSEGMKTLIEDGREKVESGITTQEELNRATAEF